jgi:5-formyltetrahydrofolate cyclo-ligase
MDGKGIARFPGAHGRIPNFQGAETACRRASEIAAWRAARVVKANPDSPQRAIRQLALESGKTLYMAFPRLKDEKLFIRLDPEKIGRKTREASTLKGALRLGDPVSLEEVEAIDLIVCGSVAVTERGQRLGKGGGYADLEIALLSRTGKIHPWTPILTVVHPHQMLGTELPMTSHDLSVDFILTPGASFATHRTTPNPDSIFWELLDQEKVDAVPVLRKLQQDHSAQLKSFS